MPESWAWPGAEMLSRKIDARSEFYLSFAKFSSLEKHGLYGTASNSKGTKRKVTIFDDIRICPISMGEQCYSGTHDVSVMMSFVTPATQYSLQSTSLVTLTSFLKSSSLIFMSATGSRRGMPWGNRFCTSCKQEIYFHTGRN